MIIEKEDDRITLVMITLRIFSRNSKIFSRDPRILDRDQ